MTTTSMIFGHLEDGFFIYQDQIYFTEDSKWPFCFPVSDKINNFPNRLHPRTKIEFIPRKNWKDHGITPEILGKLLSQTRKFNY